MRLVHLLALIVTMAAICLAQPEKPRVFVSDSNSWQISGGFAASRGSGGGGFSGGARPQTVEIIKTFGQRCQSVIVTMDKSKADYVVLFDREGGKGIVLKHDKIAVFKKGGDALYSGSTRSVGNAVQDSCEAIEKQGTTSGFNTEPLPKDIPTETEIAKPAVPKHQVDAELSRVKPTDPLPVTAMNVITARFNSTPTDAEVDIDGVYWGRTPTNELNRLQIGIHKIVVKKIGYKIWEGKVDLVLGDDLTVNAVLEVDPTKARIVGLN
jgi:hypothetical protein